MKWWLMTRSDVITIRVPFPNINSKLAVESHMYSLLRSLTSNKVKGLTEEAVRAASFLYAKKRNPVPKKIIEIYNFVCYTYIELK